MSPGWRSFWIEALGGAASVTALEAQIVAVVLGAHKLGSPVGFVARDVLMVSVLGPVPILMSARYQSGPYLAVVQALPGHVTAVLVWKLAVDETVDPFVASAVVTALHDVLIDVDLQGYIAVVIGTGNSRTADLDWRIA